MTANQNPREFHLRRERAFERMHHATLAAYLGGTFALLMFVWIGFDTGEWLTVLPFLAGAAVTVALGTAVERWRSQLAAGALFVVAAGTLVWRVVETHRPGSLIGFAFVAVYLRGFMAAVDYAEIKPREAEFGSLNSREHR